MSSDLRRKAEAIINEKYKNLFRNRIIKRNIN